MMVDGFDRVIAVRAAKTIYRHGDRAIKVYDRDYSKANVLNAALNHALVEETGLRLPQLLEVGMVDGKWAIVTEFIQGKMLSQLMKDNPDGCGEYVEIFVDLQMLVHAQGVPLLTKLRDKMVRKISQADLDDKTRYDLHVRLEATPRDTKVCHGDFNPTNIILTEDGVLYIFDWSHAAQGDAAADVATTFLLFWLAGEAKTADVYLDLFCQKSGTPKRHVQRWLPIVAASRLVEGNPDEHELLMHWINVVDYG